MILVVQGQANTRPTNGSPSMECFTKRCLEEFALLWATQSCYWSKLSLVDVIYQELQDNAEKSLIREPLNASFEGKVAQFDHKCVTFYKDNACEKLETLVVKKFYSCLILQILFYMSLFQVSRMILMCLKKQNLIFSFLSNQKTIMKFVKHG